MSVCVSDLREDSREFVIDNTGMSAALVAVVVGILILLSVPLSHCILHH